MPINIDSSILVNRCQMPVISHLSLEASLALEENPVLVESLVLEESLHLHVSNLLHRFFPHPYEEGFPALEVNPFLEETLALEESHPVHLHPSSGLAQVRLSALPSPPRRAPTQRLD